MITGIVLLTTIIKNSNDVILTISLLLLAEQVVLRVICKKLG